MTVIINDGYLWFSNNVDYLKVFCEHILYSNLVGPELEHYEGGVNLGFDLSKEWVVIKAVGVWLETNTEYVNFVSNIKSWQKANTLQVEVIRDGTNKVKIDGVNTIYPVLMTKGLNEIEKMPANQEKWRIEGIIVEQNGSAS